MTAFHWHISKKIRFFLVSALSALCAVAAMKIEIRRCVLIRRIKSHRDGLYKGKMILWVHRVITKDWTRQWDGGKRLYCFVSGFLCMNECV